MLLADLGADVIKVEEPKTGDYERQLSPFIGPMAYRFLLLNRNKRSLAINLKHNRGKDIFLELVKESDCLVEGFRPDTMKGLGLDYHHIREINPGVVYCSLSSYGHTGPSRDRNAHDLNILAESGILHMTGYPDEPPAIPGIPVVDIVTALYGAIAILSALMVKRETGKGQHLDISLFDSAYTLLFDLARSVWNGEREPQRGSERLCGGLANYRIYETKDHEYVAVAALETAYKNRLLRILGLEDFMGDEATISTTDVSADKEERTGDAMKEVFARKTVQEWNEILGPENCFYSPLKKVSDALSDPHALHRGVVLEGKHPLCGPFMQLGTALKRSETPLDLDRIPAPALGQHTVSILKGIGIDAPEIEELRNRGTVSYPESQR